jgi:hypothetical protein
MLRSPRLALAGPGRPAAGTAPRLWLFSRRSSQGHSCRQLRVLRARAKRLPVGLLGSGVVATSVSPSTSLCWRVPCQNPQAASRLRGGPRGQDTSLGQAPPRQSVSISAHRRASTRCPGRPWTAWPHTSNPSPPRPPPWQLRSSKGTAGTRLGVQYVVWLMGRLQVNRDCRMRSCVKCMSDDMLDLLSDLCIIYICSIWGR